MVVLAMVIGLAVSLLVTCGAVLRWNEVRYRKKGLPPGTMGWPVFGETTEFLKQELNRFILMNEGKGFVPGYPQSMLDILGRSNIAAVRGDMHKTMRSCMLGLVSPPMIRDQLLPKIDEFMRSYIDDWGGRVIDIQEKTKEVSPASYSR
ncbi:hypothetical protein BHE74_00045444 [Ensete ventricosum]|nr:hypothetical protein BHE74_00045444 [Ensete ventricosum]RZS10235.1 hypothetical protein BHM03_00041425 [Ensete ventricosum]